MEAVSIKLLLRLFIDINRSANEEWKFKQI